MNNPRPATIVAVTLTLTTIGLAALNYWHGAEMPWTSAFPVVAALLVGVAIGAVPALNRGRDVDPWRLQAALMRSSGQPTPSRIEINKHTITYLALCLEELGETVAAAVAPLARVNDQYLSAQAAPGRDAQYWDGYPAAAVHDIGAWLAESQRWLARSSIALREGAERMPEHFGATLNAFEAVALADGCTDLSVVSCGLAVASGVPGAPCYLDVVESNLSKANPDTGLIDKDPSGKWIKGAEYRAPELRAVLAMHKGNP